jgi:uncharacterized membrane protein
MISDGGDKVAAIYEVAKIARRKLFNNIALVGQPVEARLLACAAGLLLTTVKWIITCLSTYLHWD